MIEQHASDQDMRSELGAVLESPAFVRSPVLSRLLQFLVEESIKGTADNLKSYTVAVDGLGRGAEFDAQADTYPRVLVGRLRRALDTFYHGPGGDRAQRLIIPNGSYHVLLETNARTPAPEADEPAMMPQDPAPDRNWRRYALVLALVAACLVVIAWAVTRDDDSVANWQSSNFPLVKITMKDQRPAHADPAGASIAEFLHDTVRPYETVRLASSMHKNVNYVVELDIRPAGHGRLLMVNVVNLSRKRLVYNDEIPMTGADQLSAADKLALSRMIYSLFGYSGLVTALEARNSFSSDSPYDCWLYFSQSVTADAISTDDDFDACSSQWYRHAPRHPMASALHAWSLANSTIGSPSAVGRARTLKQAVRILENASAANPESRHVLLALARTYALLGYTDSLHEIARGLAPAGQENPDIGNVVGTLMVLQNDLSGEAQIDAAIAFHPDPPPRYFLGKFVAAMMRDDLPEAEQALGKLTIRDRSGLWGHVFQAAYLAHRGDVAGARAAWGEAAAQRPLMRLFPIAFLSNTPAGTEVETRLIEWLGPVIE